MSGANPSPGERAVAAYEIDDVFLVESTCRIETDFNQSQQFNETAILHRIKLRPNILLQSRTPLDTAQSTIYLIRYLVEGEVYFLKNDVKPIPDAPEIPEGDTFGRILLTFAADYRCTKEQHEERDAISAFGRNAVFHVWPYWREGVHANAARMRLPHITIPMLKPPPRNQSDAEATSESQQPSK
jgi:hypothetical protein